ncbi:MAG: hypothetical protein AB1416_12580, partial [Actinomycetota bacterium]
MSEEFMALVAGLLAGLAPAPQPQAHTDITAPGPNDGKVPDEPGADAAGLPLPGTAADAACGAAAILAAPGMPGMVGMPGMPGMPGMNGMHGPHRHGHVDGPAPLDGHAHARGRGAWRADALPAANIAPPAGTPAAVVSFTITRIDAAPAQDAPGAAAPAATPAPPVAAAAP